MPSAACSRNSLATSKHSRPEAPVPLPFSTHKVSAVFYWPARARLEPVTVTAPSPLIDGQTWTLALSYEPVADIGADRFPAASWTRLALEFPRVFNGDGPAFQAWARTTNGKTQLIDDVLTYQNVFVDQLKARHAYHSTLRSIRHFGLADWPYIRLRHGEVDIVEVANPTLAGSVLPPNFDTGLAQPGAFATSPARPTRSLLRASDLVEAGYPTEATLVAFALLDAVVQDALMDGMDQLGLSNDSANSLLRNTTQSRLATYLDPVLKLVTGASLAEQDPALFGRIGQLNRVRNRAIHSGTEVRRTDARKAIQTVFDTLVFIDSTCPMQVVLPPPPSFPRY